MYFDFNADQNAQRALDSFEIDNLFSIHCYLKRAGKRRYELDNYWASRNDIAYCEGSSCYSGRKSVYKVYAEYEEEMLPGKLDILKEKYPEITSELKQGAGDYENQFSGSSYIEVAKDGQTAKAVWYNLSVTAEPDKNGIPAAILHTGRAALEFVKEGDDWKIWHYRTSPDFSLVLPKEKFNSFLEPSDFKKEANAPEPNLKLKPISTGPYSPIQLPGFEPDFPKEYETWISEESFVAPLCAENYEFTSNPGLPYPEDNTEGDAIYALNYVEAINLSHIHCYGYAAQQMVMELDRFWAQRTEDLAGCHADRAHQGHNIQYKYYARGNMGMNWGKVKIMHDLYPDKVELHPFNLGIGEFVMRFYSSPYLVISEDGKTAQSVVYSFGISSEIDKKGYPVPFMQLGRECADLVLEGDSWRLLHFRLSADIDYLLSGDVLMGYGLENGTPRTIESAKPQADYKAQPFNMDEPYSPFRVANYSPEPPFPFVTWDNRSSWVLPETV